MAETTLKINAEDNASKQIDGVSKAVSSLVKLLGAEKLVDALKGASTEAATTETSLFKLQVAFNNSSDAIGVTAGDLKKLSEEIQATSTADDDLVNAATGVLLKFTQLNKETFPETMKAAADVAAMTGMELPQAAEALGRAMENPANAMRGLRAAGITLSEQMQQEIKDAMEAGDAEKARALVIQAVTDKYDGAAEKMRGTFSGAVALLKNQQDDLAKSLGKTVNEGLKPLIEIMTSALKWFNGLDEGTKSLITTIVAVASAIAAVTLVVTALIPVFTMLKATMAANPFILIGVAIGVVVAALVGFIAWLAKGGDEVKIFTLGVSKFMADLGYNIQIALGTAAKAVVSVFAWMFQGILDAINGVTSAINAVFKTSIPQISNGLKSVADGIQANIDKTVAQKSANNERYNEEIRALKDNIEKKKEQGVLNDENVKKTEKQTASVRELTKAELEAQKARAEAAKDFQTAQNNLTNGVWTAANDIRKAYMQLNGDVIGMLQNEKAEKDKQLDDMVQAARDAGIMESDDFKALEEKKLEWTEIYNKKIEQANSSMYLKIAQAALGAFNTISSSVSTMYSNQLGELQRQMQTTSDYYDAQAQEEIDRTGATGEAETAIRARYAEQNLAIQKGLKRREHKMQVEAFEVNRNLSLGMAIANGALAVINGLASVPFLPVGLAMGAAAGVATGFQIAAIMSARPPAAPAFASGGTMPYTGMALVGEQGPELVRLPAGAQVYNNSQSRAMTGGGGDILIYGPINIRANDPNEFNRNLNDLMRYQMARV